MIWKDLGEFELHTGTDGSAREFTLAVQDWGMAVKEIVYAIAVQGRKSTTAQVGAKHYHAPSGDLSLKTAHSTPIALAAAATDLPFIMIGAAAGTTTPLLPYFWPTVVVDTSLGGEEWITARIWVGGKPF